MSNFNNLNLNENINQLISMPNLFEPIVPLLDLSTSEENESNSNNF